MSKKKVTKKKVILKKSGEPSGEKKASEASVDNPPITIENLLMRYRLLKEIQDYALDCGARNAVNRYEKELNDLAEVIRKLDGKADS